MNAEVKASCACMECLEGARCDCRWCAKEHARAVAYVRDVFGDLTPSEAFALAQTDDPPLCVRGTE